MNSDLTRRLLSDWKLEGSPLAIANYSVTHLIGKVERRPSAAHLADNRKRLAVNNFSHAAWIAKRPNDVELESNLINPIKIASHKNLINWTFTISNFDSSPYLEMEWALSAE